MSKTKAFTLFKEQIPSANDAVAPATDSDWVSMWHGMPMLSCSFCSDSLRQHQTLLEEAPYSAFALETRALLSIMACYPDEPFVFMELGSGRAPWCLSVAGVIRYGLLPSPPKSGFTLALEADPTHFEWTKTHLSENNILSLAIHGAIGSKPGQCRFQTSPDPAAHMGQHISENGDIKVPVFTIDGLMEQASQKHVHAIHMDVQGEEAKAVCGARHALKEKAIDYFIVGTHGEKVEQELKELLAPTHDLVVELPCGGSVSLPGFTEPFHSDDDGVHVYQRKELV